MVGIATRVRIGSPAGAAAGLRDGARRRRRGELSWRLAVASLVALGPAACTRQPRHEIVAHGRFPRLELVIPDSPRAVALLLSGPEEVKATEVVLQQLTRAAAIVTRVDAEAFRRVLEAASGGCAFPSGDLDNLSRFVQAYLRLPSYQPAILVGLGAGAGLAAGALKQSPPGTFAGALVFDFCGQDSLGVPLCEADRSSASPARGVALTLDPLLRVQSDGKTCSASAPPSFAAPAADASEFPEVFTQLAAAASARATSSPTELGDLPISEVSAQGSEHADTFALLLSGDGGWAGIDREVSARLAQHGVPVVGIDSLRYFWHERTPEGTAADLDRVIARYQTVWNRPKVALIGYSQGADVLPFLLNRLAPKTRSAVVSTVALSLSTTATFEFHLSNWAGSAGDRPTLPEVQRLAPGSLLCVYGKGDTEALCPQLDPAVFRSFALPGDHHFDGDYDRVAGIILDSLPWK
jgi:type IV secretory pathway VirJ component